MYLYLPLCTYHGQLSRFLGSESQRSRLSPNRVPQVDKNSMDKIWWCRECTFWIHTKYASPLPTILGHTSCTQGLYLNLQYFYSRICVCWFSPQQGHTFVVEQSLTLPHQPSYKTSKQTITHLRLCAYSKTSTTAYSSTLPETKKILFPKHQEKLPTGHLGTAAGIIEGC